MNTDIETFEAKLEEALKSAKQGYESNRETYGYYYDVGGIQPVEDLVQEDIGLKPVGGYFE